MIEKLLTIQNKLGLHARASAKLVDLASGFASEVMIEKDEKTVNAKSIMGLMMLAAAQNTQLKFITKGEDEQEAMEAIETLLNNKFDEENDDESD
ncbi:MAG: phosphocarrier protein HPr [Legionellaceae bacterium]|nr:phosphocarrier protein HPr [Legionellaceae bacterium]|tara:strand:+ start:929 stop:1213 length:285 start_codon:yes stop_codon:yes gene_type:complete